MTIQELDHRLRRQKQLEVEVEALKQAAEALHGLEAQAKSKKVAPQSLEAHRRRSEALLALSRVRGEVGEAGRRERKAVEAVGSIEAKVKEMMATIELEQGVACKEPLMHDLEVARARRKAVEKTEALLHRRIAIWADKLAKGQRSYGAQRGKVERGEAKVRQALEQVEILGGQLGEVQHEIELVELGKEEDLRWHRGLRQLWMALLLLFLLLLAWVLI